MRKSSKELSAMKGEELIEYVASLSAEVDKKEEAVKSAQEKEEEAKTAQEEQKKEASLKAEEEEKKHEAVKQAVLKAVENSAMEDKDKEAVLKAMEDKDKEAALKAMGDNDKEKSAEDYDEKKALKAQVTYLANKVKTPQIEYLTKIYQAALTDEKTLKEYVAEWEEKDPEQLDAEIKRLAPLVQTLTQTPQLDASVSEVSTIPMSTLPSSNGTYLASDLSKFSKMSDAELFGGRP